MTTAIYPGSFDPVTNGHLDIIRRAAKIADVLIVAVLNNPSKTSMFTVEERVEMLRETTKDIENVRVDSFSGLTVDYARKEHAVCMVRGLRAVTDFDYELQLSQTNKVLAPEVDTVFLATDLKYAYLSSSVVKEAAGFGGDISGFVPSYVQEKVLDKLAK
ncbi:MAG: pantetheine-phosphate adenylyltransferase [Lachnospiraceae bacterium]|nr:pantetheine-phosphate adenylyltransferase [Lachnospiraceae bacterium]MBQ7601882.1 pantetheine-phosphate adenylyltransferase [Lachnospiraceae bacterium]